MYKYIQTKGKKKKLQLHREECYSGASPLRKQEMYEFNFILPSYQLIIRTYELFVFSSRCVLNLSTLLSRLPPPLRRGVAEVSVVCHRRS